jgi:heme exporter protein D
MSFMDWGKFFSMGGYAVYVWGSYGLAFILLAGEVLMLLKRKRNLAKREQTTYEDSSLKASFQESQ